MTRDKIRATVARRAEGKRPLFDQQVDDSVDNSFDGSVDDAGRNIGSKEHIFNSQPHSEHSLQKPYL